MNQCALAAWFAAETQGKTSKVRYADCALLSAAPGTLAASSSNL
jgi:hypothetical protein